MCDIDQASDTKLIDGTEFVICRARTHGENLALGLGLGLGIGLFVALLVLACVWPNCRACCHRIPTSRSVAGT